MAGGLGGLGGFGNILGAIGQSLLTSPRENPFQGLPTALQSVSKMSEHQAALSAMSTVAEKLGVPKELAASPEAMKLFIDHINATKLNQLRQQAAQGGTFTPPDDAPTSQPSMSVPGVQGSSGIPTTFNVAGGGVPGGGGIDGPGGLGGPVAQAATRTRPGGLGATPKLPTFAAIEGGTPSGKIAGIISQAADRYGVDPTALVRTAQIESGLKPGAKNPTSSAGGLFQFINSTAKQYGLTNKFDPIASADAGARLMRDNADKLRGVLGRDPQPWELYLAHQQGSGGAAKLLSNPNASAASLVGADAVRLNGGSPGMTAAQFAGIWRKRFGDLPSASQNATGLLAAASGTTPDYAGADAQRLATGGTLGGGATAGGVPLPPPRPIQLASNDPNMPLPSTAMQRVMDEARARGIGQGGPDTGQAGPGIGQSGPDIGQSGAPLNQVAAGRGRSLSVPIPSQTNIPPPPAAPAPVTSPPVGTSDNRTKAWAQAQLQRGMNILAASNGDPVLMKQAEIIIQGARKYVEPSDVARRVSEAGLMGTPVGRAIIGGLPATAVEQLTEQQIPGYVSPSTLEQKKYRSAEEERAYQHSKAEHDARIAEQQRQYMNQFGERKLTHEITKDALDLNLRTTGAQLEQNKFDFERYKTDRDYRQRVDEALVQRNFERQRLGYEGQRVGLEGERFENTKTQQDIENQRAQEALRQQRDIATESHNISRMTEAEKVGGAINAPERAPNIRAGQAAEAARIATETTARGTATALTREAEAATNAGRMAQRLMPALTQAREAFGELKKGGTGQFGGIGPSANSPASRAVAARLPEWTPAFQNEMNRQRFDSAMAAIRSAKTAVDLKGQGPISNFERTLAGADLPDPAAVSAKVVEDAFARLERQLNAALELDNAVGLHGGQQPGAQAREQSSAPAPSRDGWIDMGNGVRVRRK